MAGSLLDSLSSYINPEAVREAAARFGESETRIGRGLSAAGATMLAGLVGKAASPGGLGGIFDLLTSNANDGSVLDDVPGLLAGRTGSTALSDLAGTFLTSIFGGHQDHVHGTLAQNTGLPVGTIARMLPALAPVVMGILGRQVRSRNLGAAGLADMLLAQREGIIRAAPGDITKLLGLSGLPSMPRRVEEPVRSRPSWLLPVAAAAIVLLGLAWFLGRDQNVGDTVRGAQDDIAGAMSEMGAATENTMNDIGASIRRTLPGGVEITVPASGLEARLIEFIESPAAADETTWFEFDRLTFETGSARITPESDSQIATLAEVLKAFPDVKVKIGGYTDNTGNEAANMTLSQQRADAVRNALVGQGVDPDRIEAEGYGSQHPVASNDTEEGREQNRRIALRVTEK